MSTGASVGLAWTYVILRVAHSLLQALVNKIELRFALFVLSNIPLFAQALTAETNKQKTHRLPQTFASPV